VNAHASQICTTIPAFNAATRVTWHVNQQHLGGRQLLTQLSVLCTAEQLCAGIICIRTLFSVHDAYEHNRLTRRVCNNQFWEMNSAMNISVSQNQRSFFPCSFASLSLVYRKFKKRFFFFLIFRGSSSRRGFEISKLPIGEAHMQFPFRVSTRRTTSPYHCNVVSLEVIFFPFFSFFYGLGGFQNLWQTC
jgi:hypothetical protein